MDFPQERQDPVARLWQELEPWFRRQLDDEAVWLRDELGIMPLHGVSLTGLHPAELDQAWHLIENKIDRRFTAVGWRDPPGGAFAAASRRYMPLILEVEGVLVGEQRLPPLHVEISPNGLGMFWTVGDGTDWEPQTVAALAVLIGDFRTLRPTASMTFDRQPEIIRHAIDTYLASRGSEPEPPAPPR